MYFKFLLICVTAGPLLFGYHLVSPPIDFMLPIMLTYRVG